MDKARASEIYNYLRIDDTLATSGQPTVEELAGAAEEGVEVVVNLALHDAHYSLPDETGTVTSLGMTYVHIPVQFEAPAEVDLFAFFEAMDKHQGSNILVHCAANKRAVTFLGLYRAIRQGWDRERAFAVMNDVWEPNAVWAAFIESMLAKHAKR